MPTLHLTKRQGEKLLPYDIAYDEATKEILNEGFVAQAATQEVIDSNSPHAAQLALMKQRGIVGSVIGGTLVISSIPDRERRLLSFFSKSSPCPDFPGCEEMRRRYFSELEMMESEDCTDCDKAKLLRKYREQIEPLIQ